VTVLGLGHDDMCCIGWARCSGDVEFRKDALDSRYSNRRSRFGGSEATNRYNIKPFPFDPLTCVILSATCEGDAMMELLCDALQLCSHSCLNDSKYGPWTSVCSTILHGSCTSLFLADERNAKTSRSRFSFGNGLGKQRCLFTS
jgi:hypothetical protein